MKLSIWKQFSSNHSNSFTVVGTFKTEDDAYFAYLKTRRVLRQIIEKHQNPPLNENFRKYALNAEIEILSAYDIIPKNITEWASSKNVTNDTVKDAVRYFDNYVLFSTPVTGFSGANTFVQLLSQFTDEVIYAEEIETDSLVIDINCTVPNTTTARWIYEALVAHQTLLPGQLYDFYKGSQNPIAWLTYYDGKYNVAYEKWVDIEEKYLSWNQWQEDKHKLNQQFENIPKRERDVFEDIIIAHDATMPPKPDEEELFIKKKRDELLYVGYFGDILLDECITQCKNLVFDERILNRAVPAIIAWMRSLDCTVDYQFRLTKFRADAIVTCLAVDEITANQIVEKLKAHKISQNHIPDGSSNYLFTARDIISYSFDEITIQIYDLKDRYQLEKFLKVQGCRRIRIVTKMVEIAEGSDL